MDLLLEVRVLEAAVAWFEEDENHYTPNTYLEMKNNYREEKPGREVVAACAIGGIEQAVWLVTGKNVSDSRNLAYTGKDGNARDTPANADLLDEQHEVYWRVMRRLNLEAVRQREAGVFKEYEEEGFEVFDVEDVTELGDTDESRRLMLDVFQEALDQARAAAGREVLA